MNKIGPSLVGICDPGKEKVFYHHDNHQACAFAALIVVPGWIPDGRQGSQA
jgi:hypothetical protein